MGKVKTGIWQFWRLVGSMNRELPYHDYTMVNVTVDPRFYAVGTNNVNAHGSQRKRFVSKSTLVWSSGDTAIRFNDNNNQTMILPDHTWIEFKSNISSVYWDALAPYRYILMYFEGVLPEEARFTE
jgi:hypothetical protein